MDVNGSPSSSNLCDMHVNGIVGNENGDISGNQLDVIGDTIVSSPLSSPQSLSIQSDGSDNNGSTVGIEEFTPGGTKYWIPDVSDKPFVDKQYSSIDQLFEDYKSYAQRGGFSVRKGGYYELAGGFRVKHFYCSREGFKSKSKSADGSVDSRQRASCRIGCPAMLKVRCVSPNLFVIIAFVERHNHSLVSKNDVQFLRAYRQLSFTKKQFIHHASHANLGPVRSFKLMKQIYGGFEEVGATAVECKNFRREINMFIGDRDAQMAVEKLLSRKEFIPGYFVDYFTDDDNALAGLFWSDDVGLANFNVFGDVVSFDATFRSNKYKMVFVPFTGIDNHNRCVTFAAGLLSKENISSYKWLLESFIRAFGKAPNIVVTDQDPAMKQAIAEVFPTARHRLCMWHIMQKLTSKVGPVLSSNESFKKRLGDIVWNDRISVDFFEVKWAGIINDFSLQDNRWFSDMFGIRHDWIPAFYHDEPLSGLMRTTSRSESENHFFGMLTSSNLTLVEFLSHYDTAMDAQRYNRKKNDHHTRYTVPDMKTGLQIEVDASKMFTRTLFYDVQEEINASVLSCHSMNVVEYDGYSKCFVRDSSEPPNFSSFSTNSLYEVLFNKSEKTAVCSCKRFECYGLLCRHIFLVFRMFRINNFPESYVHKRWSKDAVLPAAFSTTNPSFATQSVYNEVDAVVREVYSSVEFCVNKLVSNLNNLSLYRDKQKELMNYADNFQVNDSAVNKNDLMCSMLGVSEPDEVSIQVPKGIRNKGCGSHKHMKSKVEISKQASEKPLHQCKYCMKFVRDHDSRNCPKKLKDLEQQGSASTSQSHIKNNKGKRVIDG